MRVVKLNSHSPETDPYSLGNLAVELGYITEDELKKAVQMQQQRLPLGKILVEMGKLTEEQLQELLFEQGVRRGEITDKSVITQHHRVKLRKKMGQIKEGFKEMRVETKQFSSSVFNTARAMKNHLK